MGLRLYPVQTPSQRRPSTSQESRASALMDPCCSHPKTWDSKSRDTAHKASTGEFSLSKISTSKEHVDDHPLLRSRKILRSASCANLQRLWNETSSSASHSTPELASLAIPLRRRKTMKNKSGSLYSTGKMLPVEISGCASRLKKIDGSIHTFNDEIFCSLICRDMYKITCLGGLHIAG
mmetsp:Transcript_20469/g.38495  ORF Transcript_20469/g.38495 Transcript_20469/m.38495 type:complete len:179 (+) Transcript_20469:107-643(+)